ncbi:MAG: PilZ domain-containing protein [Magnetococcales bacterium]|nr:PilZ domain-containing protein [Magnetococcales bacterium]NGZ26009.1 PilZ domain-containing protein [Magnetococcales bacterium]
MAMRLILVSNRSDATEAYRSNIHDDDVIMDVVDSFYALYQKLARESYQGVLIDMPTKIKAPHEEKDLVNEVLERFPVIQLGWDANSGNIRSFYYGQCKGAGRIQDFITNECRRFVPARARFEKRLPITFNVQLLSIGERLQPVNERTVTINVSRGGCYIYYLDEWNVGEKVAMRLKELADSPPITGVVRWGIHWGVSMKIPGFGISFEEITEAQHNTILGRAFY